MSINQNEIEEYQKLCDNFFLPKDKPSSDFYIKPIGKTTICGKDLEIIFCDILVSKKKSKKKKNKVSDGQSLLISRKKTIRKVTNIINCNAWQARKV